MRELERNLGADSPYRNQLALFRGILKQKRKETNMVYSLHEPEVERISKGKEHKKYELGNKASIIISINGVVIGTLSFRKEHDVSTLVLELEQVSRLTNRRIKILAGDMGYRGLKKHADKIIEIPSTPKARDSRYERAKKTLFCKRAGIEPTVGHLKSDHRLWRTWRCNKYYAGDGSL